VLPTINIQYLEDGENWKMAVESGSTVMGMDDWNEEVLNIDGWQHVLGDIYEIGDDKYCRLGGGGQIDMHNDMKEWQKLLITQEELTKIKEAWKKIHCLDYKDMKKGEKKLADEVKEIFKKYKEFDEYDLGDLLEEGEE
jgi:hypothetical protein